MCVCAYACAVSFMVSSTHHLFFISLPNAARRDTPSLSVSLVGGFYVSQSFPLQNHQRRRRTRTPFQSPFKGLIDAAVKGEGGGGAFIV